MDILTYNGKRLAVLGCVNGLLSEGPRVRQAVKRVRPELIGLPTSPEEIVGLGACCRGEIKEMLASNLDEIYARKLKAFGEVQLPPPFMVTAWRIAAKRGIECRGLDMDEDSFSDLWVDKVSVTDLIIHSNRVRGLERKKITADDPRNFAIQWDRLINRTKGYAAVEAERERFIASSAVELWKSYDSSLVIVQIERKKGVMSHLRKMVAGDVERRRVKIPYPEPSSDA